MKRASAAAGMTDTQKQIRHLSTKFTHKMLLSTNNISWVKSTTSVPF